MCGIAGFFNINGLDSKYGKLINNMTDSMIHRGPDNRGIYCDDFIALGHRRLSVIDLETGNQPMFDSEKRVGVVFNGEIYNFKELRKELESFGFKFYTCSDTEVIIHSYIKWGESFINKLNGMFAFALYDKLKRKLYLYRDRLGIKPLYYAFFHDYIIFASEPKALFFFPISKDINKKALSYYLSSHQINLLSSTLYENVSLLDSGTFLSYDSSGIKKIKYWELKFYDEDKGEDYYIENIREKLKKATLLRLISHVPLGAYLSGGVDSSILVTIISDEIRDKLKTFSVGLDIEGYNEFEYSNLLNNTLNIEHFNYFFENNDFLNFNRLLVEIKNFPLNVPNEVLLYYISKKLKEYVTVVISGEGADELFGGYGLFLRSVHDYSKMFLFNKCPDFYNDNVEHFAKESLQRLYKSTKFSTIEEFLYNIYSVFTLDEKNHLLNFYTEDDFIINNFKDKLEECKKESYYDKFLYFLEMHHLQGLLLRNDNATMAASVECRVPFTDFEFVEFAFNIPFKYKIKWKNSESQIKALISNASEINEKLDISKYILKKSFKGSVPDKILNRNKFSFPVPLNEWFNNEFNHVLRETFQNGDSLFYEYFNYDNVNNFIKPPFYGKTGLKVWMLMNLKMWMDNCQ